jgi:hypothetical protein
MPRRDQCSPEVYARVLAGNRARQKTAIGKENHLKANNAYRKRHRQKTIARDAVAYAVRLGKMLPMPCIVCGKDAEAHHPDYSQPLYVIWLCDSHHKEVHATMKEAA